MEFKPGSYKQGDLVIVNGVSYIAARDISYASAIPKDNMYWDVAPSNVHFIQALINAVPEYGRKEIIVPDGKYYLTESIKIHNRSIYLTGGAGVHLHFPQGIDGIRLTRSAHIAKSIIKNINLYADGERKGFNGVGLYAETLFKLENVTVKNFGGHGFSFFGSVQGGTDCSGSSYYDCEAIECGGDGVHMQGGDANWLNGYNFSARDCDGYGVGDFSFLGCQHFAPMLHYNKKGDFISADQNARSNFFAPYAEGGSPASEINGTSNIWGGINPNGQRISRYSSAQIGAHSYNHDYGWKFITREEEKTMNGFHVREDGKGSIEHSFLNGPTHEKRHGAGAELTVWDNGTRRPTFAGKAYSHLFIANRFVTFARSVDDLKKYDYYRTFEFIPGDKVFNNEYNGSNAEGWTCISKGIIGIAKWKPF